MTSKQRCQWCCVLVSALCGVFCAILIEDRAASLLATAITAALASGAITLAWKDEWETKE